MPPVADRFLEAPRADSRHGGSGGQPRLSSAASRLTTRPQARAEGGRPGPGGQAPKGPRRGLGWCFRSGFRAPVGVVRFSACSAGFCPGGSGGPGPSSGPGSGRPPSCFVFVGGWCVVGRRGVPFAAILRVRASGGLGRPRPSVRPSVRPLKFRGGPRLGPPLWFVWFGLVFSGWVQCRLWRIVFWRPPGPIPATAVLAASPGCQAPHPG